MDIQDRATTHRKCPKCGSDRVHRASRYSRLDQVLAWVNFYPYRCRQCSSRKRFYSYGRK